MINDTLVFISYSSKESNVAKAICHMLENEKIHCWMAPRDIIAGQSYAEAIVNGISQATHFILVFSENSQRSKWVLKEVERAISKGTIIIPVRIENVIPCPEMELYISNAHWLDAFEGSIENYFQKLISAIKKVIAPPIKRQSLNEEIKSSIVDYQSLCSLIDRGHYIEIETEFRKSDELLYYNDVNPQDINRRFGPICPQHTTFLNFAVAIGNMKLAKILLGCGFNINYKDSNFGDAAIHMAGSLHLKGKNREFIEFLLDNGADLNLEGHLDYTVVDNLMQWKSSDESLIKELIEKGGRFCPLSMWILVEYGRIDLITWIEQKKLFDFKYSDFPSRKGKSLYDAFSEAKNKILNTFDGDENKLNRFGEYIKRLVSTNA